MNRGDIYYFALDPTVGSEIRKTRPCVIVSNDKNNVVREMVTVVPLTSNLTRVRKIEVIILKANSGLTKDSKALIPQMRAISCERVIGTRAGRVAPDVMGRIDDALKLHLSLD